MSVEGLMISESAVQTLLAHHASVCTLARKLENHECFSSNPDVDFVNVKMEVKELKQSLLDYTSYALFLSYFVQPMNQWLTQSDVKVQMSTICDEITIYEQQLKEHEIKEKELLQYIDEVWNQAKQISSFELEDAHSTVVSRKSICKEIKQRLSKIRSMLDGKLLTESELEAFIIQQNSILLNLKSKIDGITAFLKTLAGKDSLPDISMLFNSEFQVIAEIASQACSLSTMIQQNLEQCEHFSCVKVVLQEPSCEVLEIGFSDYFGKESSIEVKVIYDFCPLRRIKDVIFHNCPVRVEDIASKAVELNSISDVIPELLDRLFNSGQNIL